MIGFRAEQVCVRLGGKSVLDRIDVAVPPGKVVVVIGPNGAGKSTLLAALSGEIAPASGRVTLDGADVSAMKPAALARRRAVLAQSTELAFPFTVGEVARLGLPPGLTRARAAEIVARCFGAVDLAGVEDRPCTELSGGEQQRVHLARVLAQLEGSAGDRPGYLFLDEPTASLDLEHQLATLAIARAHARRGGGVLAILHDVNLAAMVADIIVAVRQGRVVASGDPVSVLTADTVNALFNVDAAIRGVPAGPFLLPQSIRTAQRQAGPS